jgi:hypothetical protein
VEKDTLRGITMACAMNLHYYFGEGTKQAEKYNSCYNEVAATLGRWSSLAQILVALGSGRPHHVKSVLSR